ncbi:MAG: thioredoxin family protein [Planctomycetaceae bacterium]|nr:thioredoxin family protein [Planctomycetaceae bacterium]
MNRIQLFFITLLVIVVGILGCNVKLQSMPPSSSGAVTVLPKSNSENRPEITSVCFLDDYRQGLEIAKQEAKLVLIFFTIPNSDASQRMMETTFRDEEIKRLSNRFVCIRVDGSKESDFCKSIGIKGFPTVLFMTPQGEELQRLAGKLTPDQLALPMHVMIQTTATKIGSIIRR